MSVFSILDTSMFSESIYDDVVDGDNAAYRIEISDYLGHKMNGILKGGININMSPEWSDLSLGNVVNNFAALEKVVNFVNFPLAVQGVSYDNAGFMTEKFFSKGGYLEIEPTFDVVNWRGDGAPIVTALFLLNYCVPNISKDYNFGDMYDMLKSLGSKVLDKIDDLTGGTLEKITGVTKDAAGATGASLSNLVSRSPQEFVNLLEGAGSFFSEVGRDAMGGMNAIGEKELVKTQAPSPVNVKVSNYFNMSNMIITNFGVEFSDKITETGPMKAEFKLTLSSKTMPTLGTMGLKVNKKNRVIVQPDPLSMNTNNLSDLPIGA